MGLDVVQLVSFGCVGAVLLIAVYIGLTELINRSKERDKKLLELEKRLKEIEKKKDTE